VPFVEPLPFLLIAGITLLLMEPAVYLAHRYVMHGFGAGWHNSHHKRRTSKVEKNDLFPVVFASITIAVMFVGSQVEALRVLLPIGAGVTAYGLSYAFVHELYIHRRLPFFTLRIKWLEPLVDAHVLHHRFNGEPYGFLYPIVPAHIKAKAARLGDKITWDRAAILAGEPAGKSKSTVVLAAGHAPDPWISDLRDAPPIEPVVVPEPATTPENELVTV
jgi:beta-carotene 3-hydroxylase